MRDTLPAKGQGGTKQVIMGGLVLFGAAVITAFTVNAYSPKGLALFGQWDTVKGVISANAKNDVVVHAREIGDVETVRGLYGKEGVLFVDARPEALYEDGHIRGAISFPVRNAEQLIPMFLEKYNADTLIVTYCSGRECEDSHILAEFFNDFGFSRVQVFVDGFPAWEQRGYPIE